MCLTWSQGRGSELEKVANFWVLCPLHSSSFFPKAPALPTSALSPPLLQIPRNSPFLSKYGCTLPEYHYLLVVVPLLTTSSWWFVTLRVFVFFLTGILKQFWCVLLWMIRRSHKHALGTWGLGWMCESASYQGREKEKRSENLQDRE